MVADHADRRRVITLFQSIQMLCPILPVILLLTAAIQPWMVIVLSLIVGVTDALSMPSFQSILVLAGLSMNASNISANSLLQASASPLLRGQSVSLYMLAMRGGLSVGSLLSLRSLVHQRLLQESRPETEAVSGNTRIFDRNQRQPSLYRLRSAGIFIFLSKVCQ